MLSSWVWLLCRLSPGLLAAALILLPGSGTSRGATGPGVSYKSQSLQKLAAQPLKPILLTDPVPDPKQAGVVWFEATGHTLRGEFLAYWNKYGGLAQFGYPLTEEFFEPVGPDNKQYRVQYFERNRFEYHPENAGTEYEVLLGVLGRDFRAQDPPASPLPAPALYFPQTGHNLSGPFKSYWETHGGLFVHGYPITEQFEEANPIDGKTYLVQYFERSRFEYHPENAGSPYEVLLGLLGRQLAEKKGYPYGWYPPYGHAADYSWISGNVELYGDIGFARPEAGCSIFRYGDGEKRVQLQDSVGNAYRIGRRQIGDAVLLVIFGRLAAKNEQITTCSLGQYRNVNIYIVEQRLRSNPVSTTR